MLSQVQPHLTQALLAEFEFKAREFGTLNRVYCATPACSRFLGPLRQGFFRKVYKCTSPTCTTKTCGKCRGKYKRWRHNCTPDAETQRVLTLGSASGWSRCPGCAHMIEHDRGCYHMTCRCKTQFCYLCRARWGSCKCAQWGNRLLAAAQGVYAQLQPVHHAQPPNPPRQAHAVYGTTPAAGAGRNEYVNPPRQEPAAAPRPERLLYCRRTAHHAEASAPTPWNGIIAHTSTPPLPGSVAYSAMLVANARHHGTGVAEPHRPSAANTAGNKNTARRRTLRETTELLGVDHDCQHTTWTYHHGGRCESCYEDFPIYIFVRPFRRLLHIYTPSHRTIFVAVSRVSNAQL
jgi:hypothetical protein